MRGFIKFIQTILYAEWDKYTFSTLISIFKRRLFAYTLRIVDRYIKTQNCQNVNVFILNYCSITLLLFYYRLNNRPLGQQGQQSQLGQQSLGQFPRPVPSNPNSSPLLTFGKAIEEITRNDDFQCIPKVICQMVGTQRRLPPIFSSPIFSA